jgi:hypothetical protein
LFPLALPRPALRAALALQLKKSGKSKQSRKLYKLTVAGIKAVEAMIARGQQDDA